MIAELAPGERPRIWDIVRAGFKMIPLIIILLLLLPFQWLANLVGLKQVATRLPIAFHWVALRCMGVRIHQEGANLAKGPVVLAGNHVSWLDIVMIGASGRFRFISKDDVADWPVFGTLARLQNTLFVSRTRKTDTGKMTDDMRQALADGDRLVLFAEGTTSDGGQVLPFRPALLGALVGNAKDIMVQPFTIAYVRRDGLPISRGQRATLGWYGDLDLLPSLLDIIHGGPLDVSFILGEPKNVSELGGRKPAALHLETEVRKTLATKLRGRDR
ncbi:MAG: lysophospholipid acyltransferase family protein [Devosiaceae bacterium]